MHASLKYAAAFTAIALACSIAVAGGDDKNAVKVPGGIGFAEFKGYENWQLVSISENGGLVAAIFANPVMIDAFRAGAPGNGKPFPDGSKMAKVHWTPGQGQQAIRRQRQLGLRRVRIRRRERYVQARHDGGQAAAVERREVRLRVPHAREDARLRLHGVRASLSLRQECAAARRRGACANLNTGR